MKIKIVFFDEAIGPGGSVVVLAHLFRYIDRARFVPKLVTALDRQSVEQFFDPDDLLCEHRPFLGYVARARWMRLCPPRMGSMRRIWAYLFTAGAKLMNLPGYVRLLFNVARVRPDILHANNASGARFVSRLLRVPLVWHLHGFGHDSDRYIRRLRRDTARFISVSNHVSSQATARGIDPRVIDEIPNPAPVHARLDVDRTQCLARFGVSRNAFVLAHVGRLVPWKGQTEFLKAFISVAPAHPNVVALLVGDDLEGFGTPYTHGLRQLVEDAGVSDRVVFAGHVVNILELMSAVDVVVHSSIMPEPFGLVITEAMVAGAAVIAARAGGPLEIIDHGVNGLLVDPRNTQEFADALAVLIEDAPRRHAMAREGLETVRERYSPEEYARRVEAVYERILLSRSDHTRN